MAGLVVLGAIIILCWVGPLVYRVDPLAIDMAAALEPPSADHLLGTDNLGRDVLARIMGGGQISISTGVLTAASALILGMICGLAAALYGGVADAILMRTVDVVLSIPTLFLTMLLSVIFKPGPWLLSLLVAIGVWSVPARLVRAEAMTILAQPFCEASLSVGSSKTRIGLRHVLPNSVGTLTVNFTFQIADAILLIAALSFLGFGIAPPTPSWGGMLTDAQTYVFVNAWWLIYPVGGMIIATIVAISLMGDGLRDALESREAMV